MCVCVVDVVCCGLFLLLLGVMVVLLMLLNGVLLVVGALILTYLDPTHFCLVDTTDTTGFSICVSSCSLFVCVAYVRFVLALFRFVSLFVSLLVARVRIIVIVGWWNCFAHGVVCFLRGVSSCFCFGVS